MTKRFIIFGNSGAGKSTMARQLSEKYGLVHLDLDTLAWQQGDPPRRNPVATSQVEINFFLVSNERWVVEGCYSDLLGLLLGSASKVIFLNPGVEQCIKNCTNRPWEPHKYKSLEAQNTNLPMLLEWVRQYANRDDEFSLSSHQKLFDSYTGDKIEVTSNYWQVH